MSTPVSPLRRHPAVRALGLAAAFFAAACSTGETTSVPRTPPPVPVTIGAATQKAVPVQVRAIGAVEANSTVAVRSMVPGQVMTVGFSEGTDVRKGDLLFVIDPRTYEAALRLAEAALAKDRALKENAEREVGRYASLIEKDLVPRQQYDQIVSNAAALAATVSADVAAVENARLRLGYCTIRSPIDGRTGSVLVDRGNVVKENDTVLVTINQVTPIRVAFSVPELHLADIRRFGAAGALAVEAMPRDGTAGPARGTLSFLGNAVDQTTGTIPLKATFANADRRLWPGQFVNIVLTVTTRPDAVVVPAQAVQTGQQGQYVFVVRSDLTVEVRPVAAGQSRDGETVIEKGLRAGERVVTDGQLRLVPGARVAAKG
jgi:membrane fusion protein, multidrug efflux system